MKEEVYTAPANFKRGKLIVGSYKVSDLIIIGVGVFIAIGGILLSVFTLEGIGRYFRQFHHFFTVLNHTIENKQTKVLLGVPVFSICHANIRNLRVICNKCAFNFVLCQKEGNFMQSGIKMLLL